MLDDPRMQRVLEWELTAPAARVPRTQIELAAELGVTARSVRDWKDKPEFQAAWKIAFRDVAGSMERTKAILDQLYADAMDQDNDKRTQAAKLHWDISRAIAPPEPEVTTSQRAQSLSDAQLRELLSQAALEELTARMERAGGVAVGE